MFIQSVNQEGFLSILKERNREEKSWAGSEVTELRCYLFKHTRTHTPTYPQQWRAHCLMEARHSGENMTVAIVCQPWYGYCIIDNAVEACGTAGLSARSVGMHSRGICDISVAVALLVRRPAGPSFELAEELMTWLTLLVGEGAACAQCHTWPLIFMSQYLSLIYHGRLMNFPALLRPQFFISSPEVQINIEMSAPAFMSAPVCVSVFLHRRLHEMRTILISPS